MLNSRHKAILLPPIGPGTIVFVKDLQRSEKVIEAAATIWSYEVETPTSTIRRNRVHLTPLPDQRENQQLDQVPAESQAATPIRKDVFLKETFEYPCNT